MTKPDINDYPLNQDYPIMLPVLVWVQIGEFLRYADATMTIHMPGAIGQLVQEINDICFPENFQLAERAREEGNQTAQAENHPVMQLLRNFPQPPYPYQPFPGDESE